MGDSHNPNRPRWETGVLGIYENRLRFLLASRAFPVSTTGICFRMRVDLLDRWLNFRRMSLTLDHSGEADGSREGDPGLALQLGSCRIQVDSTCDISSLNTDHISVYTAPFCPHTTGHPSNLERTRW